MTEVAFGICWIVCAIFLRLLPEKKNDPVGFYIGAVSSMVMCMAEFWLILVEVGI